MKIPFLLIRVQVEAANAHIFLIRCYVETACVIGISETIVNYLHEMMAGNAVADGSFKKTEFPEIRSMA